MDNKFIPKNQTCPDKIIIADSVRVDIRKCLDNVDIFSQRQGNESYDKFLDRLEEACKSFHDSVFEEYLHDDFCFLSLPREHHECQWARKSEFLITGGGFTFSLEIDSLQQGNVSSYVSVKRVNTSIIENLFDYKMLLKNHMFNLEKYIVDSAANNTLKCKVWLARTGVGKRREAIEKECFIGDTVEVIPYHYGQCIGKQVSPVNDNAHFMVRNANGKEIGDICFGNDIASDNDDNKMNREYWDIFRQLLIDETVVIKNAKITKIIRHGTTGGRKIKALVELTLKFELIGDINYASNKIITSKTRVKRLLQKAANKMCLLGAIDYNRKCDIISGKENYNNMFEDIFPDTSFTDESYSLVVSDNFNDFSLIEANFSPTELEEFWGVYSPAYCAIKNNDFIDDDFVGKRSVKTENMLFVVNVSKDEGSQSNCGSKKNIILSIYRKKHL